MDTMIYCQVNVIMNTFTPSSISGMPATVGATMEITGQTPNPSGAPYFSLQNNQLAVNVPTGTPARVEYTLENATGSKDIFYIFGMFFSNAPKKVEHDIGMFPLVLIAQGVPVQASMDDQDISPQEYTVSVVDQNDRSGLWQYTIGIQDLNTGMTGVFDPGIVNEQ